MSAFTTLNNNQRKHTVWFHIAAIAVVAVWGTSFISTKVLLECRFNPVEVFLCRCAIAYLLLLALSLREMLAIGRIPLRQELLFMLCGVCGGSVYFVTENTALIYTSTTNVSLITSAAPLITAFLVGFFYRDERPNRGLMAGSLVALLGVVMVVLGGAGDSSHQAEAQAQTSGLPSLFGDMLALLSAVCWAFYGLLLRKFAALYSALYITRKTFFYGFITALPFLLTEPSQVSWSTVFTPQVIGNLLFLGIVCSSGAFLAWTAVTMRIGTVKANNYLYFQPMATMIVAALVLGESTSLVSITGCLVTIGGVWLGENLSQSIASRR